MVSLANNESRFISYLFLTLWLILTTVFVIKRSLQTACWPLPSLLPVFPWASISVRRWGITLWHWGGLQTLTLWGLLRMCAIRLCFDPGRALACYTQARKRVASHYLCPLNCASLPVWTRRSNMGTGDRHIPPKKKEGFLTTATLQTAVCLLEWAWKKVWSFNWPACHNI